MCGYVKCPKDRSGMGGLGGKWNLHDHKKSLWWPKSDNGKWVCELGGAIRPYDEIKDGPIVDFAIEGQVLFRTGKHEEFATVHTHKTDTSSCGSCEFVWVGPP
jgi:hypothetical protein